VALMKGNYVLREKKIVKIDDTLEWAREFESMEGRVGRTFIGDREVSTVFLGLDMSFDEHGPVLFETMVFNMPHRLAWRDHVRKWGLLNKDAPPTPRTDDPWHSYCDRYSGSYDQAEEGHRRTVKLLKENPHAPPGEEKRG